ncbi:MAG: efflux RND transporter periplasmic adaptor subunit [Steroidobacteraceae bacterium]
MRNHFALSLVTFVAATVTLAGCAQDQAGKRAAVPPPPRVSVARVISRTVIDSQTFTGRFQAVQHVNVRPRVSGYIASVNFTYGSEVHKGQVLFVIDPRPYEAVYQRAKAQLDQVRAQLALAKSEHTRAIKLLAARAISTDEYDTRTANALQSGANVEAAKAALETAALNLQFTRVTAPVSGRVSRAIVTTGNFVTDGQTLLTTIVSLNPIYVTFDADEQAYLRFERQARRDVRKHALPGVAPDTLVNPVYVGLEDESGYPHVGRLVFIDNALDPDTGTIRARALLPNPDGEYVPGLFARVKLMGNDRYDAVLINDSAVGTDQTLRYVFLLGADNRVQLRPVVLGPEVDGLRVVRSGLKPADTIVVDGLMRVRPGAQVSPELVAMGEHDGDGAVVAQNAGHDRRRAAAASGVEP